MDTESKGKAWFGKIYNKLETILVEVDTFTSQSPFCLKSSGWESVRGEPEENAEDHSSGISNMHQHYDRIALSSCQSPSDPPSHQIFEISGNVQVLERAQDVSLKENLSACSLPRGEILSTYPLLQDYCDVNIGNEEPTLTHEESPTTYTLSTQKNSVGGTSEFPDDENVEEVRVEACRDVAFTVFQSTQCSVESFGTVASCNNDLVLSAVGISTDDSNLSPIATKIPHVSVQDNVANMRSSNEDDVINCKYDVSPLDTKALYGVAFREDPSHVDDNALYAVRVRTKKLRSFKRKILDTLNSKRRREKEYEQLAIWFGEADIGSDLANGEDSKHVEATDSKSSQVLESEDSQWELL